MNQRRPNVDMGPAQAVAARGLDLLHTSTALNTPEFGVSAAKKLTDVLNRHIRIFPTGPARIPRDD